MNRLNTGDTGQAVTSSNDGLLYSGFIGDGMYVLSSGSEFEVEVQSNNLIRMADGSALMQGRHIEIPASDSEYITINNGSQGMNRKDLVVFRYTKDVTGVESVNVVVIEGEETSGTAQVPDYIEGDILTGATLADMPLYVVELQGINITAVTPQFETIGSHKNAVDKIAEHTTAIANLDSNLSKAGSILATSQSLGTSYAIVQTKTSRYNKGSMFSVVSDGGIKCNKTALLKVTGYIAFDSASASDIIYLAASVYESGNSWVYTSYPVCVTGLASGAVLIDILVPVTANQIVYLRARNATSARGSITSAQLNVEFIE